MSDPKTITDTVKFVHSRWLANKKMKLFLMFESIKFGAMVDEKLPQS